LALLDSFLLPDCEASKIRAPSRFVLLLSVLGFFYSLFGVFSFCVLGLISAFRFPY